MGGVGCLGKRTYIISLYALNTPILSTKFLLHPHLPLGAKKGGFEISTAKLILRITLRLLADCSPNDAAPEIKY